MNEGQTLKTAMKYLIGLDIGGTKCAVVWGNEKGEVLQRVAFATPPTYEQTFAALIDAIQNIPNWRSAQAVGVSCGGPLDSRTGVIMSPPNLPGWADVHIVDDLRAALGLPAYLQNDANACALAEWRYGAGQGCDDMVFMTFGTGLGAGLILGGRLHTGTNDLAGEVGHIRLADDGPLGYGKHGSWEGFCSGGGIARMTEARLAEMECRPQWAIFPITAQKVCEAAADGDLLALSVIEESAKRLGQGCALLADILNPQRIIIGSVYARAESLFADITQQVLEREALPVTARVQILPAALGEALGDVAAISVALDGLKSNEGVTI